MAYWANSIDIDAIFLERYIDYNLQLTI